MTIAVLGGGAFGTALAMSLSQNEPVTLWMRSKSAAESIQATRQNPRLANAHVPERVTPTNDIAVAVEADILLLAVPMQSLTAFIKTNATHLAEKTLVCCCKGIDMQTGLGPVAVVQSVVPKARVAILTGPSFAEDIAGGLPTALTLAATDDAGAQTLQGTLSTPNLRVYRSTDVIGAELGGALKNVMAIACGILIGAGLGESAKAALMTRGFAEMTRLALACGARPETLAGLSGFGDLALTCGSTQSRNFAYGMALGSEADFDATITVEGAATARAVIGKAQNLGIEMPIAQSVVDVMDGTHSVKSVVARLMQRPLKEE